VRLQPSIYTDHPALLGRASGSPDTAEAGKVSEISGDVQLQRLPHGLPLLLPPNKPGIYKIRPHQSRNDRVENGM